MAATTSDPYHLQRFLDAQQGVYEEALLELEQGHKQSHWMWFIFPQLRGLGYSDLANYYGISGASEASAYAEHAELGARLRACCRAILQHRNRTVTDILGYTDALKLRSCMTLFNQVVPEEPLFREVLDAFYAGEMDGETIRRLEQKE